MANVKVRNPIAVIVLFCLTCGIYPIYWIFSVTNEMKALGATKIPHPILIFIPLANLWFFWMFAEGFSVNVKKDNKGWFYFILWFIPFGGFYALYVIQTTLNEVAGQKTA